MHVLKGLKRFLQFVIDADTYCLWGLAIRSHFKKPATVLADGAVPRKKRAKAVNAG